MESFLFDNNLQGDQSSEIKNKNIENLTRSDALKRMYIEKLSLLLFVNYYDKSLNLLYRQNDDKIKLFDLETNKLVDIINESDNENLDKILPYMSDDIVKTVGRLEANYEHMKEHQQKLEASIEAMPKKITDDVAKLIDGISDKFTQEIKNQITTLNADMTVKIGKIQSEVPNKWALYLWLATTMIGFGYFLYNSNNKSQSTPQQPTIIMMPYSGNASQSNMQNEQPRLTPENDSAPKTGKSQ